MPDRVEDLHKGVFELNPHLVRLVSQCVSPLHVDDGELSSVALEARREGRFNTVAL